MSLTISTPTSRATTILSDDTGIKKCDIRDVSKHYVIQKSGPRFLHQQSMELSWVRREAALHGLVCRTPKYSRSSFLFHFFLFPCYIFFVFGIHCMIWLYTKIWKGCNCVRLEVSAFSEDPEALMVKSWNSMKKNAGELGLKFFLRIFEIAPLQRSCSHFWKIQKFLWSRIQSLNLMPWLSLLWPVNQQCNSGRLAKSLSKSPGATYLKYGVVDEHFENSWGEAYDLLVAGIKNEMKPPSQTPWARPWEGDIISDELSLKFCHKNVQVGFFDHPVLVVE